MQNKILSLLVDNTSGVLSRIAGMFSRRGYNIDSITAGVTADVNYTRITVVCSGDDAILDQIVKQLAKLVDVRDIKVLDPSDSVVRETVLVKVAAAPEQRQGIVSIADIFRAKVVDVSKDSKEGAAPLAHDFGTKSSVLHLDRGVQNPDMQKAPCPTP